MKISIVSEYSCFGGGVSQSLNELAPLLRDKGHDVMLVTVGNEHYTRVEEAFRQEALSYYNDVCFVEDFKSGLEKVFYNIEDSDIVHIHETVTARTLSRLGAFAARARNIPYFLTIHTSYPTRPKEELGLSEVLIKDLTKYASKVIAVSDSVRKALVDNYDVPSENIEVVDNGVNLDRFNYIETDLARNKLSLPLDKTILTFVGRMVESKGCAFLKELADDFDGVLLTVGAGANEYFEGVNNVITYEYVDSDTLNLIYSAGDALVLPSTRSEGMPLVLLESLASGTPVLVANALGNTDVLNDEIGEIFEPNDLEDFLNKIPLVKSKSSKACREHAKEYTWDACLNKQLRIYDENRF